MKLVKKEQYGLQAVCLGLTFGMLLGDLAILAFIPSEAILLNPLLMGFMQFSFFGWLLTFLIFLGLFIIYEGRRDPVLIGELAKRYNHWQLHRTRYRKHHFHGEYYFIISGCGLVHVLALVGFWFGLEFCVREMGLAGPLCLAVGIGALAYVLAALGPAIERQEPYTMLEKIRENLPLLELEEPEEAISEATQEEAEPESTPHNCPECGTVMERRRMDHSDGTPSNEYCYCCGRCGITVFPEYFEQQKENSEEEDQRFGRPARTRLEVWKRRRGHG